MVDTLRQRETEFKTLWNLIYGLARRKTDYSKLSHVDLTTVDFLNRIWEIHASYMILFRSTTIFLRAGVAPAEMFTPEGITIERIVQWNQKLTPEILAKAYCVYPHWGLIGLLLDLKMERELIDEETEMRFHGKLFTSEMILLADEQNRVATVQKMLEVEKIALDGPKADTEQEAVNLALELWKIPDPRLFDEHSPLPAFPGDPCLEMLTAERQFYDGPMARAWETARKEILRDCVPKLEGVKESIPNTVINHTREERRTTSRHVRILQRYASRAGEEVKEEPRTESWWSDLAEVHARTYNPEESLIDRENGARVYDYFVAKHGESGRKYLDTLIATGGNVSAASETAEVSRVTGHEWKKELQVRFPKRNLAE